MSDPTAPEHTQDRTTQDRPPRVSPVAPLADAQPARDAESASDPNDPAADEWFVVSARVARATRTSIYHRRAHDPVYRALRILTRNPASARLLSSVAVIDVPYEPLEPGPVGTLFEVDDYDSTTDQRSPGVVLDTPRALMENGREPASGDPLFHQQMVYAVCSSLYAPFRLALGREIAWAFERDGDESGPIRLRIRPHAFEGQNAFYDPDAGELCFGYYRAEPSSAGDAPGMPAPYVFTCLSHDVIAHELTHAFVHGVHPHFAYATGHESLAFQEAFADLVALFQHLSYRSVVQAAIRRARGVSNSATPAALLGDVARQLTGDPTGGQQLWDAVVVGDAAEPLRTYFSPGLPIAKSGAILVSAVFEAFSELFARRVERYVMLATNGSTTFAPGALPDALEELLAREACSLARRFLVMCIRALDYAPPVDITFGEFLRGVMTADHDLQPDDRLGYRDAWIEAFRRRGIYPPGVDTLVEDTLLWRPPAKEIPAVFDLSFGAIEFAGDPSRPAPREELLRQARVLGRLVSDPRYRDLFGVITPDDPRLGGDAVSPPCVESVRTAVRVGADGQVSHETVAEISQRRTIRDVGGGRTFDFRGGTSIILDSLGRVRYAIAKNVANAERLERQLAFLSAAGDTGYWRPLDDRYVPAPQLPRQVHEQLDRERGREVRGVDPDTAELPVPSKASDPPTARRDAWPVVTAGEEPATAATTPTGRRDVFISYSQKDRRWLDKLKTAVKPLERDTVITTWDDTKLQAGDRWREEIDRALASAELAVLLISEHFVASDFIITHELPTLRAAAEEGKLRLLCIALSDALHERLDIGKFQWLNDPQRPLKRLRGAEQNRVLVEIARDIENLLSEH